MWGTGSLSLYFLKGFLGYSWRCRFTSNSSNSSLLLKADVILFLLSFSSTQSWLFLVIIAQIPTGPFLELIQSINQIEKVSTFFHWINCLPGSAMNWLMEKSDGYQDWWEVRSARMKELEHAPFLGNSELKVSRVTSPWSCNLMILRLCWKSWPRSSHLLVYCRSFRVALILEFLFVRVISSLTNNCINISEGIRNSGVRGTGRVKWSREQRKNFVTNSATEALKNPPKSLRFPFFS